MSVIRPGIAVLSLSLTHGVAHAEDNWWDYHNNRPGISDSKADLDARQHWRDMAQKDLDAAIDKVIEAERAYAAAQCEPDKFSIEKAKQRVEAARGRMKAAVHDRIVYEEDLAPLRRASIKAGDESRAIEDDKTSMPATRERARRKHKAAQDALQDAQDVLFRKVEAEAEVKIKTAVKPACDRTFDEAPAPYTPREGEEGDGDGIMMMIAFGGAWGDADQSEFLASGGARTNAFSNDDNAFAAEVAVGYDWAFGDGMVAGIEAGFALRELDMRQSFPGGAYLAAQSDWSASLLGSLGVRTGGGVTLSALAGISLTDQTIELNFGAGPSGGSELVTGYTLGGQLAFPLALSPDDATQGVVRFTYTGWDSADIARPSGSPLFDYEAEFDEYRIFFGIRLDF